MEEEEKPVLAQVITEVEVADMAEAVELSAAKEPKGLPLSATPETKGGRYYEARTD